MNPTPRRQAAGALEIAGAMTPDYERILTNDAVAFVGTLAAEFGPRRQALLGQRQIRQAAFDAGQWPDFLPETREIRESEWRVAPIPADLLDRRVEITGPVDRKMIINALNSGARTFMADFEDSSSPTWHAMMDGQVNLGDAVDGTISYANDQGKRYALGGTPATLLVRPRGWHLEEAHLRLDGQPVSASLVDFGLFFFHNAKKLLAKGSAPYFYLPKLQSHREARLWNEVFDFAQDSLGIPRGTLRATVLIETIPAAFEMDEILWELRTHSGGLNCGRWDYIFSFIKCFRNHPEFVLPDRAELSMTTPFLRSYSQLLIRTCHRRGIHAMGGMAAQIPIKNDPAANARALEKVRADKEREASDGHDGTWVAHPGLIPVALEVFAKYMPGPNQIDNKRGDVRVGQAELLKVPSGRITMRGLATNVSAAIHYTGEWLSGLGCVPLNNLMEDAATAEISRTQIWQWVHHPRGCLEDGTRITPALVRGVMRDELQTIRGQLGEQAFAARRFQQAADLIERMVLGDKLPDFLTSEAYPLL